MLTRQAIDSMVPAALLRVEPHHRVLDLAASPGSKTTQLLEALNIHGGFGGEGGGGQGLTLVHFSAQPKPFLILKTSQKRLNTPSTPAMNSS